MNLRKSVSSMAELLKNKKIKQFPTIERTIIPATEK